MPDLPDIWGLASVLSKLLGYLAMVTVPGTALVIVLLQRNLTAVSRPVLHHILSVQLAAALSGVLLVSLYFLLQIGSVNQQGPGGMLDYQMGAILADTALGEGTRMRLAGFVVAVVPAIVLLLPDRISSLSRVRIAAAGFWMVSGLMLASSFAVFGHVANLPVSGQISVIVHFVALGMWVGSLYPLYRLCQHEPVHSLKPLLKQYGKVGSWMIGALVISGVWLLWLLAGSFEELFGTAYGLSLVAKLLLVLCLLGLGALNRFRLVPTLADAGGVTRLKRSISIEMLLALMVLIVTASLTTLIGPM